MTLNKSQFNTETHYQVLMYLVRKMLRESLLTLGEYRQIASRYAASVSPPTGDLLSTNDLLFRRERGKTI